jgi:Peptidase_C39 like family
MKATALILALTAFSLPALAGDLSITPRTQETYVWCWVAVGQMVFEYYDVPNVNPGGDYQCGIIGLLAAGTMRNDCAFRCQNCTVPAGSSSGVIQMIEEYPRRVAAVGDEDVAKLRARHVGTLSPSGVRDEIEAEHPIIAGISPSGRPPSWAGSQHVALIVGYDDDDESDFKLLINDPYPFAGDNPYERAGAAANGDGSYTISYAAFRDRLNWRESYVVVKTGTYQAVRKGDACCFIGPYGRDACPLVTGRLPIGSTCTCVYPAARFIGRVCEP